MATELTQERLRELLHYDPETGIFTWIKAPKYRPQVQGKRAGNPMNDGYRGLMIDGKTYLEHRLAVLYVTGKWPDGDVDHADGDGANNRWNNLRDGTTSFNCQNRRGPSAGSKSGYLGVCPAGKKWKAGLRLPDKTYIYLGVHETPEAAHAVYLEAKRKLHDGCTI